MSALGRLVVQLALDHAEYTKGLDRNSQASLKFAYDTQRTFDKAANDVKSFATRSIAQVGAFVSAVAGISASFNAALDFDRELANVSTLLDDTAGSTKALGVEAEKLAREFGGLPVDQVKAFYELFSAGVSDTAEATEILTAANKLAVGGVTDVMTAVNGLTSVMSAYGDKAGTVTDISDAFFVSAKAGKTAIGELASNIGKVSPIASAMGVSFDELTSTVAALTNVGISTKESITGVRAILAAVAKPTSEATKLASELGLEFNSAALSAKGFTDFLDDVRKKTGGSTDVLARLFGGVEALVPIMSLAGNAGNDFNNIMGNMAGKAGATETAFNKMADSRGFKIDKLMASINSAALTLGGTLADVLAPAAEWAAEKLNQLFGAQRDLSAIEKQEAALAGMRKELAALNDTKHIPVFGDLFFDKRQADLLAQRIEDSEEDLQRMVAALKETAKESKITANPVQELADVLGGSGGTGGGLSGKTKKARDVVQEFIDAIKKQASEAGKTAVQIKRMEAAQLGVLDAVEPYLKVIEDQATAEEALRISRQKQQDDLRKIEQLTLSMRTKQEVYNDTVKELDELLGGGLSVDTYSRALKQAQDELTKTETKTRDFWDSNEQIWIQGVRNIQSSLANGLFGMFDDGLKGMISGVKRAVGQMLAEFASIKLLQASGIAGLFGMGSTAAMASGGFGGAGLSALNIASLGSGALNLINSGFGATSLLSSVGNMLPASSSIGSFLSGMSGNVAVGVSNSAALSGASFGSFAGPALAAAAADMVLRQIFGDKKLSGTAGDVLGYVPIVGTLINGLFGRGAPKFQNEALIGNVSAGGFSGVLNQAYREKGGLARGDRVSNFIVDTDSGNLLNQFGRLSESGNIPGALRNSVTDPAVKRGLEVGKFLDEAFGGIGDTLQQTSERLGLSSDALNSFSAELDLVSAKGETLSEAQISDEITRISDAMIATLIPNLDELAKKGETSADTLNRLNNQFSVLQYAAELFGNTSEQAGEKIRALGLDGQTALIDSLGGTEVAAAQFSEFYNNVFSDSQKLEYTKNKILDVLKPLGIDFVPTLDQLFKAVQSGNPKLAKAALEVDGLVVDFNQLTGALNGASAAVDQLIDASTDLPTSGVLSEEEHKRRAEALARDRNAFTAGRRESQMADINALKTAREANRELEIQSLRERSEREKELVRERYRLEEELLSKAKQKGGLIGGFVDSLRAAARSISPDTFSDAFGLVQKSIASVRGGADFDSIINDRLKDSLASLDDISAANFATFEEFAFAQGRAASAVNELAGLGEHQLSIEQLTLGELEMQTGLLKQLLDRDLRRVDSGLQFDINNLGSANGLPTTGDTYKRIVENQFRRAVFVLANDINPDPAVVADAQRRASSVSMVSTADFGNRPIKGFSQASSGLQSSDSMMRKLLQEIELLRQSGERTARILSNVTQGGDKLRTT